MLMTSEKDNIGNRIRKLEKIQRIVEYLLIFLMLMAMLVAALAVIASM